MKTNRYMIVTYMFIFLCVIAAMMLGVQYICSLLFNFSFSTVYGAIFLPIVVIAAFVMLTPLSLLMESLLEHIGLVNQWSAFIIHTMQLIAFMFIVERTVSYFAIVTFHQAYMEYVYYAIMYGFFFVMAKCGNYVKQIDEQTVT